MHALQYLIPLMILTTLLASCDERNPTAVLLPAVETVVSKATPAARRAELHRQLAAVCPQALSDVELERAAQIVETERSKGATWLAGRLLRMHRETRKCRGA